MDNYLKFILKMKDIYLL